MISILIVAKNEAEIIDRCLESAYFADEIVVVDGGSKDETVRIAKKYVTKVYKFEGDGWDTRRQFAADKSSNDWIFYLDADERISKELREEILQSIKSDSYSAYQVPRKNIMLGRWLKYGGWYPDYQTRLIKKAALIGWQGEIHESAKISGNVGVLKNDLIHLTHRSVSAGILKMLSWAKIEAQIRFDGGHKKVTWPQILKASFSEVLSRVVRKSGWRDGTEGILEGAIQGINVFFIFVYLWEMQRHPSLSETYREIDKNLPV